MKIYVYPADRTGCGYFRLIWPAEILRSQGHDIEIMDPGKRSFNGMVEDDVLTDVYLPDDADVIVLQRVTHRHVAQAVKVAQEKGVGVVVDIDDDLSTIHPKHPAFMNLHPNKDPKTVQNPVSLYHNWHNTALACDNASVVTVSSDALLRRYAKHGRGFVVRNYLPEHYLTVPHEDSDLIGWGGSVVSHPEDLDIVGGSIRRLLGEGQRFRMVGPSFGVAEALNISEDVVDATDAIRFDDWPWGLAQLGIGIAPIRDNKFNEAKSWLKPLEFAGLGIPCVMSPRAEYTAIHREGIGLLANKPDQWYKQLKKLATDAVLRQELSERSREVASTMTISKHIWRWAEAWTTAYQR